MPEIRAGKRCHPGKNEWMDDKKRFAGAEMRRDLPGEQISGMERWMTVGTNGPRHERLTLLFSGTEQNELKSGIPKRAYNIFEINLTPCLGKVKPEKGFFCSFDDFRPKVIVLSHCEENSAKAPADKSSSYRTGPSSPNLRPTEVTPCTVGSSCFLCPVSFCGSIQTARPHRSSALKSEKQRTGEKTGVMSMKCPARYEFGSVAGSFFLLNSGFAEASMRRPRLRRSTCVGVRITAGRRPRPSR